MTMKSIAKFEEKLILGSKNDIRNLVKFNSSSSKSENLHFHVLLSPKIYYVWAKKIQRSYVITLKIDPNFEEKLNFLWKMTWRTWQILTRVVESLKTCTFMSYFCRKYVMFEPKKYRGVVSWKMACCF